LNRQIDLYRHRGDAQIIAQVASHIYGGTTINRIDEVLAPFVTASFNKHRKIAEEWQIPDAEGYARPHRKRVLRRLPVAGV
jgi:ribonucleoside-triphosphate reductase